MWKWPWFRNQSKGSALPEYRNKSFSAHFFSSAISAEELRIQSNYTSLAQAGFMANPVAHRSVRMISQAAANIPFLLYQGAVEHGEHPLLELLRKPNERQAGMGFMEALYGHLLLSGNAYVELVGNIENRCELHLLRPDRVASVTDERGWPIALEYYQGSGKRRVPIGMDEKGGALQLSLFHPINDYQGFPPLASALVALDVHNAAGRWNKALLDNSARPSGVLVYDSREGGHLNQEQFDRIRNELENNYSGASRAGRPMLLEGGLDWKQIGLSPRDMDFIETRNSASRDIALSLGVPPMLVGLPGDNTYANYQEANRAFYRLTVLPLAARVAGDFSAWLAPVFGRDLRLSLDLDQVEGLSAEREALWSRIGKAEFLTEDEKRESVGYTAHKKDLKDFDDDESNR